MYKRESIQSYIEWNHEWMDVPRLEGSTSRQKEYKPLELTLIY